MSKAGFYPHSVGKIERIETHISILFLTGDYVYKLKKPVDFGFLDFTRLKDREFYCEEELRLNRRTAPELYLEVVAICSVRQEYALCATSDHQSDKGTIVEYAVKMRQFDHSQQLDLLLDKHQIELSHINELAEHIADFHQRVAIADQHSRFGNPDVLLKPCLENLAVISPGDNTTRLRNWTYDTWKALRPVFEQRKKNQHVRECHGDLHLANIAIITHHKQDKITLFDCIEFSEDLRWIDTISDLAFLLMDLESRDQSLFSTHCLNHYLSITGDYDALRVVTFYKVYRALVRAKVAALQKQRNEEEHYVKLALGYINKRKPVLFITFGLSGSGKTWGSQKIADQCGLVHIRSDVERKRLAGMHQTSRTHSELGEGLYSSEMNSKTYAHLLQSASMILESGHSLIIDATFLKLHDRQVYSDLAAKKNAGFVVLSFQAKIPQLEQNIIQRQKRDDDASDAGIEVLYRQRQTFDPLQADEMAQSIEINFGEMMPINKIKRVLTIKH
jgi:aminoglycoside phosphotransferase family enzyme/predicted kinase